MPQRDQKTWLKDVLGVDISGSTGPTAATPWKAACQKWELANHTVDQQIAALQTELKKSDMPALREIAEFGMNGLTGDNKVKVMASLIELGEGSAAAMRKSGPKALGAIGAFRAYLDADERVEVCDDNPFGIPVTIRKSLTGALAELQAAIEAALGARPAP